MNPESSLTLPFDLPPLALLAALLASIAIGYVVGRRRADTARVSLVDKRHASQADESQTDLEQRLAERTRDLEAAHEKLLEQERYLQRITLSDPLTGLANRFLLAESIDQGIARAKRHSAHLGVLMVDIENFSSINDRFGREIGDELLVGVAKRLSGITRAEDTVARITADQFAISLEGIFDQEDADRVKAAAVRKLSEPFSIGNHHDPVTITAEISCAFFPDDGNDADGLLRSAERMMHAVKKKNPVIPRTRGRKTQELERAA